MTDIRQTKLIEALKAVIDDDNGSEECKEIARELLRRRSEWGKRNDSSGHETLLQAIKGETK